MNDSEALAVLEECPIERKVVRPTPRKAQVELWGAQKDYNLQRVVSAEPVNNIVLAEIVKTKINWPAYVIAATIAVIVIVGPFILIPWLLS